MMGEEKTFQGATTQISETLCKDLCHNPCIVKGGITMKYVRRLALAIVTFVIGVAISPIRFDVESIACGSHNSGTSFRSSYFMQTSSSYVGYKSEQKASDAFNEELNEAVEVIELKPKVNKEGVLIEQRAIGKFYNKGTNEFYVMLFWRQGRSVRRISSRSYIHVKDFERQNF